jgi:hypothetical protein
VVAEMKLGWMVLGVVEVEEVVVVEDAIIPLRRLVILGGHLRPSQLRVV